MINSLITKIDTSNGPLACHPWIGSKKSSGYPILWNGKKHSPAHILLWELINGKIPKEKRLTRICGNRFCMNLNHYHLDWHKKYKPKLSSAEKELEKLANRIKNFWDRVDKSAGENNCWLWTGGKNHLGYGKAGWNGKNIAAHRLAWIFTYGKIPPATNKKKTMYIPHSCYNPICVNPKHLFIGTQKDNLQDAARKKRLRTQKLKLRNQVTF